MFLKILNFLVIQYIVISLIIFCMDNMPNDQYLILLLLTIISILIYLYTDYQKNKKPKKNDKRKKT